MSLFIALLFTLLPLLLGMILLYFYLKFDRRSKKWANITRRHRVISTSVLLVALSLIIFGIGNLYLNKFRELFIQ